MLNREGANGPATGNTVRCGRSAQRPSLDLSVSLPTVTPTQPFDGRRRRAACPDPSVCCAACAADPQCKQWTLNGALNGGMCYLKAFVSPLSFGHKAAGCFSGHCSGCVPDPPPPPPPNPPPTPLPPFPPMPPKGAKNILFIAVVRGLMISVLCSLVCLMGCGVGRERNGQGDGDGDWA